MSPRCFELVVTPPRAQKSPYAALTKNGSFHLFHMTSCKLWCNFCLRSEAHLDAPPNSNIIKTQSTWQWFIYLFNYFLSEMIIFFSDLLLGLLSGKKQQPFNKSTHKPVIILSHNRHSAQEKLPHSVSRSGPPVIPESYTHHSAVANYSPECSCNKSSGCLDAVTQVTCSKLL